MPDDFPDMFGRHVLFLRLDKPEFPLVAVPLGIELLPFSSLLLEARLRIGLGLHRHRSWRRRRKHRVGGLRSGRRRNRRNGSSRRQNLAVVPHLEETLLYPWEIEIGIIGDSFRACSWWIERRALAGSARVFVGSF